MTSLLPFTSKRVRRGISDQIGGARQVIGKGIGFFTESSSKGGTRNIPLMPEPTNQPKQLTDGGRSNQKQLSAGGRSNQKLIGDGRAQERINSGRLLNAAPEEAVLSKQPNINESLNQNGYNKTPVDLYRFGNPEKPPRIDVDIFPVDGKVGPELPPEPHGLSLYSNPEEAPLTGKYYKLPAETELPDGIEGLADGSDVIPGSKQPPGHHTIYPKDKMPTENFIEKIKNLKWDIEPSGNKKKPKK